MSDLSAQEMCELIQEIHNQTERTPFCNDCILLNPNHGCLANKDCIGKNWDEIQRRLKEYKESKIMTYKKDFLGKFPNANINNNGVPTTCKGHIYGGYECATKSCPNCWNEELPKVVE